jgi:hypothetical protein
MICIQFNRPKADIDDLFTHGSTNYYFMVLNDSFTFVNQGERKAGRGVPPSRPETISLEPPVTSRRPNDPQSEEKR